MKSPLTLILFLSALGAMAGGSLAQDYPIQPVPFTAVKVNDRFWAPRIRKNHEVTIPIAIEHCYKTGRVDNFLIAAKLKPGKFQTEYPFDDSDIYKIVEGASYSLQMFPDPKLEAQIDTLIDIVGKAQEPDGYLYTNRTIDPENLHPWAGKKRWEKDPDGSHELYNLGHLYEAAAAHYLATGKKTLLNIAVKSANLLVRDFDYGHLPYYPGHQVVEMGLVKMYRVTGKQEYLNLAKYFLEIRRNGQEYNQAHLPVRDQTTAVGHAVRATYMYSGMADVAALAGVPAYDRAIGRIWDDLLQSKIYLTGGIGATAGNEGFSTPYELPNLTAYNETCASIGEIYWNHRLFLLSGEAKYFDVLERILYNGMISGVSLSGDRFFYPNPLESAGKYQRSAWFGCACCPSNVCRFIPSIPGYIYAVAGDRLFVNLFVENAAKIRLLGEEVEVIQQTEYPWKGKVRLTVNPVREQSFELALRIPGWARNEAIPGGLYSFAQKDEGPIELYANRKQMKIRLEGGYALLSRKWKRGDTVTLSLPMPVRRVLAQEKVAADQGRAAIQRGPLVYCAEWPDYQDGRVLNLLLDEKVPLASSFKPDLLEGVEIVTGEAKALRPADDGKQEAVGIPLVLIPYYAWANRGPGEMQVWLPMRPEGIKPPPMEPKNAQ